MTLPPGIIVLPERLICSDPLIENITMLRAFAEIHLRLKNPSDLGYRYPLICDFRDHIHRERIFWHKQIYSVRLARHMANDDFAPGLEYVSVQSQDFSLLATTPPLEQLPNQGNGGNDGPDDTCDESCPQNQVVGCQ